MAEVLIVGSTGGREHELGISLSDNGANNMYFTHGNVGTAEVGENLGIDTLPEIIDFAKDKAIGLIVMGPEKQIIAGWADAFRAEDIPTFGTGAAGAQLEGSKARGVMFMENHDIPHPESKVALNLKAALELARALDPKKHVVKGDGQGGGKAVVLPETIDEALRAVEEMMTTKKFGEVHEKIVFQHRLDPSGPEASVYVVTDGTRHVLLPFAQDHKRLLDGDKGPNTGGMGAYTPLPFADAKFIDEANDLAERTIWGATKEGINQPGVYYLGDMQDTEDDMRLKLLEFNMRFGDPETQVVLGTMRANGVNVFELINSAAHGHLETGGLPDFTKGLGQVAVTVCLAAEGYGVRESKDIPAGDIIYGLDGTYEGVTIHHGGTKEVDGRVVTAGGRILYITALGQNIDQAAARAYAAIDGESRGKGVHFRGMQYRKDIAQQARSAA